MRLTLLLLFLAQLAFGQSQYVNPFIGTGGHGHTFPGATVPFGMVQLSPDTRIDGSWDGCSGYHYSDSFVYGFSHTHLSGTGVSDYGDILFLPSSNPIPWDAEQYKSKFSHADEEAQANYYTVNLPENGVKVRLTTAVRTGFHEYTFEGKSGNVLIDLQHRDKLLSHKLELVDKRTIRGYRISSAWAKEQHCYFYTRLSQPIEGITYNADSSQAILHFENLSRNQLQMDVGISFTSMNGAKGNLEYDLDFMKGKTSLDDFKSLGQQAWDKELSKIEVFTEDENKKHIFYTALYHCMIHPNIAEDADGKFRGHDMKIHDSPNHTQYTVFSLWDTYRALHPLMTIIDEQRTKDFINSFLEIYKQSGRLPVWELASNETDCMIGYHSVSVIADAYMKGIRGFDTTLALEAMVASANTDLFGLPSYRKYGFVRAEDEPESVSKTLEYAYDDWCIAQMARAMGEDGIANVFRRRSESWRNIINPETGFATPRLNGDWLPNFDPKEVNLHFTEANSWQYSFVQQEFGMLESSKNLEVRLDALFSKKEQTTGRTQSDITGLIGQYAHGNEPSHHIAYLYNYTAHPEKGQKIIKQICDSFYTNTPDGLIGNEDCGQMSAWYVLSSSGFYPIKPGSFDYAIGSCPFDSVHYNLLEEKKFSVINRKDIYAQDYKNFITHANVLKGIGIETGEQFQLFKLGTAIARTNDFCPTPLLRGSSIFNDSTTVEIIDMEANTRNPYSGKTATMQYLENGDVLLRNYDRPFDIYETTHISAFATCIDSNCTNEDGSYCSVFSPTISATFYKKPNKWTCTSSIPPNSQYTGGGKDALIDGIQGTANWQAGRWQGYQNEVVTFDLDFNETKKVQEVQVGFLQDARSWILMPSKVEVFLDGKLIGSQSYEVDAFTEGNFLETITVKLDERVKIDKLEVRIYSAGKLPKGHQGHTMVGDAFFFVDELKIK
jgi:predicted alpha-1,2-mannosidase